MSLPSSDEPTLRIGTARVPTVEHEERRRVEIGALVFGALLAGALIATLFVWLAGERTSQQAMFFVFMTLTSGAVVGIFVSVVAGGRRRMLTEIRSEHAKLRLVAETNTQQGMTLLRSVAMTIADARIEFDKGLGRVYSLVADALERGGMASTTEVAALRAEVEALRQKTEEAVTGYAAGFVDGLIAQEEQDSGHPHLRVIKQNPMTRDDGPWSSGGGKR